MVESGGKISIEESGVTDQMIREITAAIVPLHGCVTPLYGVNDKLELACPIEVVQPEC